MASNDSTITRIFNSTPVWVRVAATLGVPTLVLAYLLARDAGYIPSPISETRALIQQHIEQDRASMRLLWSICRNTAKSDVERHDCGE